MKKKNRVKARQDIGCEFGLRPNLLLTSLPPSFVLSFRPRSLTFLPTLGNSRFSDGNRNSIVYPRFMKKKLPARLSAISPENSKYITYFVVLDFPSDALRAHFSPPLLSRNFDIRGRSSTRPSFSKLEGEIIGRSVIQADDDE